MDIKKIEAGVYEVVKDDKVFQVVKDSFVGGWGVFNGPTYSNLIVTKPTKKDCLDFIENDCSFKNMGNINNIPRVEPHDCFKYSDGKWVVDDVIYSTVKGKWIIKCSNDTVKNDWDYDDFEDVIGE